MAVTIRTVIIVWWPFWIKYVNKRTQVNATYFIRSKLDLASLKTYDLIYNSLKSDNFVRFGCNNKNYHFSLGGHFGKYANYTTQVNAMYFARSESHLVSSKTYNLIYSI